MFISFPKISPSPRKQTSVCLYLLLRFFHFVDCCYSWSPAANQVPGEADKEQAGLEKIRW